MDTETCPDLCLPPAPQPPREGSPVLPTSLAWGMASPACGSHCGCAGSSRGFSLPHPLGCRCPSARTPTRPHRSCHSSARAGSQQPRSPGHWVTRPLPPRLLGTLSIHSLWPPVTTVVTTQRSHPPMGTLSWGQDQLMRAGRVWATGETGASPQQCTGGWVCSVDSGLSGTWAWPPAGEGVPGCPDTAVPGRHSGTST